MMRYLRHLADKDLALDRTMIPLGSCTMKLNAAAEMMPVSWSEFADLHPFCPAEQAAGYHKMMTDSVLICVRLQDMTRFPCSPIQARKGNMQGLWRYAAIWLLLVRPAVIFA